MWSAALVLCKSAVLLRKSSGSLRARAAFQVARHAATLRRRSLLSCYSSERRFRLWGRAVSPSHPRPPRFLMGVPTAERCRKGWCEIAHRGVRTIALAAMNERSAGFPSSTRLYQGIVPRLHSEHTRCTKAEDGTPSSPRNDLVGMYSMWRYDMRSRIARWARLRRARPGPRGWQHHARRRPVHPTTVVRAPRRRSGRPARRATGRHRARRRRREREGAFRLRRALVHVSADFDRLGARFAVPARALPRRRAVGLRNPEQRQRDVLSDAQHDLLRRGVSSRGRRGTRRASSAPTATWRRGIIAHEMGPPSPCSSARARASPIRTRPPPTAWPAPSRNAPRLTACSSRVTWTRRSRLAAAGDPTPEPTATHARPASPAACRAGTGTREQRMENFRAATRARRRLSGDFPRVRDVGGGSGG